MPALAIRFVLLMTLMPAGYAAVIATLAGTWRPRRGGAQ